jgi:protein-disulfide isomerase
VSVNSGRFPGGWIGIAGAGLVGLLIGGAGMLLVQGGAGDAQVERVVHDYILDHPEIIPEAMERLEQRQAAAAIEPRRAQIETPFGTAWAGAANGDVVLVEFFDYACGYCRASNAAVNRLLSEDPRLKVVWRELPVLGPDSQQAAFVSLAAAEQGRFRQFYDALFGLAPPNAQSIARAQQAAGVQAGAATEAHRQELQRNVELANLLRANGTPTFVVGDQVLHGAVGYERLKEAIEQARARRS